ncbi:hypothetical protein C0J52_27863, partial [Blattella germanica]
TVKFTFKFGCGRFSFNSISYCSIQIHINYFLYINITLVCYIICCIINSQLGIYDIASFDFLSVVQNIAFYILLRFLIYHVLTFSISFLSVVWIQTYEFFYMQNFLI